jgi:phosphohistidine phosphatase
VLLVMRHGRAEQFAAEDHQRRLTTRGVRDARGAGEWLVDRGLVPTHALVSSALRARDTWVGLVEVTGLGIEPVVDDAVYSAGPENALDLLRATPADAEVVLLIGHNPTAASLAHLLDDGDPEPEAFRLMSAGFPPAAVAVLDVHVPWAELEQATARLVGFYPGH